MKVELKKITTGTIFRIGNKRWIKDGGWWGLPSKRQGAPDHIVGKESVQCSPEYGGQFQPELKEWIPTETVVEIE